MSADPLAVVVELLDRAEIPYMLAGSFASTYHGSPRTTQDIDVVIAPTCPVLDRFVRGLDEEWYSVREVGVDEDWRRRGMFNVLLLDSGWKVDLILRKDRPFSRSEFERRIRVDLAGGRLDRAYIERWVGVLGLVELWTRIESEDSQ